MISAVFGPIATIRWGGAAFFVGVISSPTSPTPGPAPPAVWVALPTGGLAGDLQLQMDGLPTRVKYEPQTGDGIFLRHRYTVGIQEHNGQYGEMEIGAYYFG